MKGLYKHFKGKYYKVIGECRDSDNCKIEYVMYKSLYEGDFPKRTVWIREKNNFLSPGRFTKLNLIQTIKYYLGVRNA